MFQIGQKVRVSTGWTRNNELLEGQISHFLWEGSIVEVIDYRKEYINLEDAYFVYAEPECFISRHKGISRCGYSEGVQLLAASDLEYTTQSFDKLKNSKLPRI